MFPPHVFVCSATARHPAKFSSSSPVDCKRRRQTPSYHRHRCLPSPPPPGSPLHPFSLSLAHKRKAETLNLNVPRLGRADDEDDRAEVRDGGGGFEEEWLLFHGTGLRALCRGGDASWDEEWHPSLSLLWFPLRLLRFQWGHCVSRRKDMRSHLAVIDM